MSWLLIALIAAAIAVCLGLLLLAWSWARIAALADSDIARFYRDQP